MRQILIRPKIHLIPPTPQLLRRSLPPLRLNQRIDIAMAHKYRRLLVRGIGGYHIFEFGLEEEVAAQAEDAAEACRACDAREQAHCSALAEAAEDDALGGDAGFDFFGDEVVEDFLRAEYAGFVFGAVCAVAEFGDVVPTGIERWRVSVCPATRSLVSDRIDIFMGVTYPGIRMPMLIVMGI